MYFMIGDITMESKMPSVGGFLKAALSSESIFRPTYTGTGELYQEPTAGGIHSMHLDNEAWMLENGAYYGSEMGVEVDVHREKALTAFKSGEGFLDMKTKISGTDTVLVKTPGPVEELVLENNKLVVDGKFAFARSSKLNYSCQKATKSLLGSVRSGEGMVRGLRRHRQGAEEPHRLLPVAFPRGRIGHSGIKIPRRPSVWPLGAAGSQVRPINIALDQADGFPSTRCSSFSSCRIRLSSTYRKRRSANRTRRNIRPLSCLRL